MEEGVRMSWQEQRSQRKCPKSVLWAEFERGLCGHSESLSLIKDLVICTGFKDLKSGGGGRWWYNLMSSTANQPLQRPSRCPVGQLSTGSCPTTQGCGLPPLVVLTGLVVPQESQGICAAPWWCFQALHPAHSRLRSVLETSHVTFPVVWN